MTCIFLVDEHEDARQSLVRRLESGGRVRVAAHVATVDEARVVAPTITCDLALINVQTYDSGSLLNCRELRKIIDRPLIVLASFMTERDWLALKQAGADGYLLKRANSANLADAIIDAAERYGRAGDNG
jgi:two-component system nitrate/nitrite response regulator NarP